MKIYDRASNKLWRTTIIPKSKIKLEGMIFKVSRPQINKSSCQSELWLVNLLRILYQKIEINTLLDEGANIGQTLLKVEAINLKVSYIGFEPNPLCFVHKKNIIDLNRLSECILIQCGLGSEHDIAKLRIDQEQAFFDSKAYCGWVQETKS